MAKSQVLIRDIESTVVDRLKQRAKYNERSFEAELRIILKEAATEKVAIVTPELERAQRHFKGRFFSDSTELIREDRER